MYVNQGMNRLLLGHEPGLLMIGALPTVKGIQARSKDSFFQV